MGKLNIIDEADPKSTKYANLRGCDFSTDASLVASNRSPLALNMISDDGGSPKKRLGWRTFKQFAETKTVHNIWYGEIGGIESMVAHVGTKLYAIRYGASLDGVIDWECVYEGLANIKGTGFFMRKADEGYLFFTDSLKYYYYDGVTCGLVKDIATRPKVLISRNPTGGGTMYQAANLLTGRKTVSFLGNSTDKVYYLPYAELESIDEVRVRNSSGEYEATTAYTADLTKGTITFSSTHAPVVTGQDNVEVDFTKTTAGYADKIGMCTISATYGLNAQNRVFLSGNFLYKSYDWYSEIYDPTYIADTSYAMVGTSDTAIMGYLKVGEYLAIIKEDNSQDTTIFLRYGELSDNEIVFKTKQGVVGIGAISKHCFYNLGDEPLFLTRLGVYAVTSTLLSYERVVKNRSMRLNKKLCAEANLDDAVACEWNGYYIVAVNNHAYILDGRHKSSTGNDSEYSYEGYYWENIPATCFLSLAGELYFGTKDGRICKFNTDIDTPSEIYAYNDDGTYEYNTSGKLEYKSGGTAIVAQWATPNDDDGGVHLYKRLMKKGGLVVLSPQDRTSASIYFIVDGDPETYITFITKESMDIFNWEDIDFERFTFNSKDTPQEIYFNKKVRKYKRLQIIVRNDTINEPFGIFEIIKTYTVGNYSRR